MRRPVIVAVVMALVASTLGMAAPARAAETADCFTIYTPPRPQSVRVTGLTIEVDPDQVGPDVVAAVNYWVFYIVVGRVLCLEGGVVTGTLACYEAKIREIVRSLDPANLNLRYVRRDPTTGNLIIDGNLLVADLTAC